MELSECRLPHRPALLGPRVRTAEALKPSSRGDGVYLRSWHKFLNCREVKNRLILIDRRYSRCLYFARRSSSLSSGSLRYGALRSFCPAMRADNASIGSFCYRIRARKQTVEGAFAVMRVVCTRRTCRNLTAKDAVHRVSLSGRDCCTRAAGPNDDAIQDDAVRGFDEFQPRSRDVYVLLHAGVLSRLNSEASSDFRDPTRCMARWVFYFQLVRPPKPL